MSEVEQLLKRQSAWQASRRRLSWPEKIRMAEAMRETLVRFRRIRPVSAAPGREEKEPEIRRPADAD